MLRALHWLPVCHRIQFKVLVSVFKCLHGSSPDYVTELVHVHRRDNRLRQPDTLTLSEEVTIIMIGKRVFGISAPPFWNRLPITVRASNDILTFKITLKTNLFKLYGRGIKYALQFSVHAIRYYFVTCTRNKVQGIRGGRLGQLVVTPEVLVSKINNMKENKSPGVDGISPKILKETVEQISTPLAHVFNMSLQEGIVPFEWKEANIIPLFKKGSRNKSVN